MATITHETLFLGYLTNAQADVYDPATGVTGCAHNIIIHNTNTTSETVEIWKHNGTVAFRLLKMSLAADATFTWDLPNDGLVVDGAHKIQGKTTTNSMVTIDISGSKVVL